jgi:hypothetical protein
MDLANWPGTSLAAMLAAVLALASSLSWGLSDFLGGFQSRRHALLSVLVLSQGFALVGWARRSRRAHRSGMTRRRRRGRSARGCSACWG